MVVGAPHGKSGKTTITVGLLQALRGRGIPVQAFKKGPDYIDPSWLEQASLRPCHNLDSFLMTPQSIIGSVARHARGMDLALVEGNMGLYDGADLEGSGSTAELARIIQAPVLLVVDATRITRSVAAVVMGFQVFDPGLHIGGVILNRVARPRHEEMLRQSIEKYCGIPVLGAVPRCPEMVLPDRHLGLLPPQEWESGREWVEGVGRVISSHVDLDALWRLAASAAPLAVPEEGGPHPAAAREHVVIGVFRDRAFHFYYPENLEALEHAGARLVFIDSLADKELPPVDGLYIGGGFPEVMAAGLEANVSLRRRVRRAAESGLPVYAECGGLMYLGRTVAWQGKQYKMAGALPLDVVMEAGPQGHGYVAAEVVEPNPFWAPGQVVRGHEFHHSLVQGLDETRVKLALRIMRGHGLDGQSDGITYKNVFASYLHVHALGEPSWAEAFVRAASEVKEVSEGKSMARMEG
ncbi:MAG: cobyrinate a,c-diamide synthase [Firmicutes bacterium]|nr:cobyrinate a,c-diamide synthase [Bacillota bacterium]